jgi:secreted trypsin-like serine protease
MYMKKIILMLVAVLLATVLIAGVAYAKKDGGVVIQIVGGDGVENGQYPFVSAILDERISSNPNKSAFCTGVLIDDNSVATAAHCLRQPRTPTEDLSVTVGKTVLSEDSQGVVRDATGQSIHPKYGDPCGTCHDVGVINFDEPVPYAPIPIGGDGLETPGRPVIIAGWGSVDRFGTNYPDRLQKAGVPIVGDEKADNAYAPGAYVKALHVAAGRQEADTCAGDSGGPLFDNTDAGFRLIGLTSWGPDPCAQADKPGVYTEANAPSNENYIVEAAALNN